MNDGGTRLIIIDDAHPSVQYTGTWTTDLGKMDTETPSQFGPPFNHTLHGTNDTSGSSGFSFDFNGTSVRIVGSLDTSSSSTIPQYFCKVDDSSFSASLPSGTLTQNQLTLCETLALSESQHHFELSIQPPTSGGNMATLYFDVAKHEPMPALSIEKTTVEVAANDSQIWYSPQWVFGDMQAPNGGDDGSTDGDTNEEAPCSASVYTAHVGANVKLMFNGTNVVMTGYYPASRPQVALANYTVDPGSSSSEPTTFTLKGLSDKAANVTFQNQVLFTTPDLPSGPHTLEVTYLGPVAQGANDTAAPLTLTSFFVATGNAAMLINPGKPTPGGQQTKGLSRIDIVLIASGGVLFLALIVFMAFFIRRRRRIALVRSFSGSVQTDGSVTPFISQDGHWRGGETEDEELREEMQKYADLSFIPERLQGWVVVPQTIFRRLSTWSRHSSDDRSGSHSGSGSGNAGSSSHGQYMKLSEPPSKPRPQQRRHTDSGLRINQDGAVRSEERVEVEELPPLYTPG